MKEEIILYYTNKNYYFYDTKADKNYKIKATQVNKDFYFKNFDEAHKELLKIVKDNGLNTGITGRNIVIIVPYNYTDIDKDIIHSLFEKIGFNKIKIYKEFDLLPKNNQIIKLNSDNLVIFNKTNTIKIDNSQFNSNKLITKYLELNTVDKCYFYGENKNIFNYGKLLSKPGRKVYVYSDTATFLFNEVLKMES